MLASAIVYREVVGIDPGTKRIGFCRLRDEGGRLAVVDLCEMDLGRGGLTVRLRSISRWVQRLLAGRVPSVVVVEDGYVGKSARASIVVAMARGAVVGALDGLAPDVLLVGAPAVRKSIGLPGGGMSRAEAKGQVMRRMQALLCHEMPGADAADAAALAYYGAGLGG